MVALVPNANRFPILGGAGNGGGSYKIGDLVKSSSILDPSQYVPANGQTIAVSPSIQNYLSIFSGYTLIQKSTANTYNLTYGASGNGTALVFVDKAAGLNSTAANTGVRSVDGGTTWTSVAASTNGNVNTGLAFGNGVFVLTDNTYYAFYSVDGITTWTSSGGNNNNNFVYFVNGYFFTPPGGSTTPVYSATGTGGWTAYSTAPLGAANSAAYGNGVYACTGAGGYSYASNIASWTTRSNPYNTNCSGVAYGNGIWLMGGDTNITKSTDCQNWSIVKSGACTSINFLNGLFIITTVTSVIITSDGINFITVLSGAVLNNSIAIGSNIAVFGAAGYLATISTAGTYLTVPNFSGYYMKIA